MADGLEPGGSRQPGAPPERRGRSEPRAQAEADLLAGLPPPWPAALLPRIRRRGRDRTLVVLDDDPTGTQTVRGVRVLIDPSTADLAGVLAARAPVVFVLTNSRSLPGDRAAALARRLGRGIRIAARRSGRAVSLVSRSDSTLRGHFPVEVDALAEGAGIREAPVLLMPYLGEAGRVTVGDVHYLVRDGTAVPVAQTEFARDPAFGYRESNLLAWVAARLEGTPGVGAAGRPIARLPLETIRGGGPDAVASVLRGVAPRTVVVANAADDRDAEVVAAAVAELEGERPIVARTAAGYVRARAGQPRQPVLSTPEVRAALGRRSAEARPGLVVVGSHVPTSTRQLAALLADPPVPVELVEVPVLEAAEPRRRGRLVRATVGRAAAALDRGVVPVVATSRELVAPPPDDPTGLRLARRISRTLAQVVRGLEPQPAWIVAKGGITSSDVAALGLGARVATVVGPLLPGVPAWRVPRGRGAAPVLLAVFPGNVGGDGALRSVVELLSVATLAAAPPAPGVSPGAG